MHFTCICICGCRSFKGYVWRLFCSQWKEFTISASWSWCWHERPTVNVKLLVSCIQYMKVCWNMCRDVNVTALVFIMWLSYMQVCCCLYEWISHTRSNGCAVTEWSCWEHFIPIKQHHKWPTCSSADSSSTFSSHQAWNEGLLWRSWTGIEKILVSASEISTHYHSKYQRRDLHWFSDTAAYVWTEKTAWEEFRFCVDNFPGNQRAPNYRQVEVMLQSQCLLVT